MNGALAQRFSALRVASPALLAPPPPPSAPSPEAPFRIETGTIDDYRALSRFHYRSRFPGAVTGIIRAVIDEPSVISRFHGTTAGRTTKTRRHRDGRRRGHDHQHQSDGYATLESCHMPWPHRNAAGLQSRPAITSPSSVSQCLCGSFSLSDRQVIGVLVMSLPSPACRLRDLATADRYRNLGPRDGTTLLNREVRCISRVIVDPRFRGTGVAVQLVRHALERMPKTAPGVRFTEALAAMGRVSPFFERAGMHRYERPLREDESRLIDAMSCVSLDPTRLASISHAIDVIESQPRHRQAFIERELRRWRRASARMSIAQLRDLTLRDLLIAARDKLLLQPVYFIADHSSGK